MGKYRYGVILDAGSSGTRVYIYKWLDPLRARINASKDELASLPELITDKSWTKKIHPGISTFNQNPEDVGEKHLKPLLEHALQYVPKSEHEKTPFFLLATAGMRLLANSHKERLLREVCDYVSETTKFQLPDCEAHVQVIKGETEGLYGWVAANYLLGGFDRANEHNHGKNHHTYGFLDMGGASSQIAFAPNATEAAKHAEDLNLLRLRTVGGLAQEYKVFVTTWLGFGANEARRRYVKALEESTHEIVLELPDPCLPAGLNVTTLGEPFGEGSPEYLGQKPHLLGTGKFEECLRQTHPLLEKDKPCLDAPCLINGQHVPAIDFDVNHFVGVSEYWHTTHEVFEMGHQDKAYDFKTYQQRVEEFCSQPWKSIEKQVHKQKWGKKVDTKKAEEVCFKASWLINMLHEGIGIPRVGIENLGGSHNTTKEMLDSAKSKGFLDPFQAVNKIKETEVSWTLGKMVLYASSQIPPSEMDAKALPVGFGTNTPGVSIPEDFQFASGVASTTWHKSSHGSIEDGSLDWHDSLFTDSPRRIPGFLLFLAIIIVACYFLCGRQRRSSLLDRFSKARGLRRRNRNRFGIRLGKAFGGRSGLGSYDRLQDVEDGFGSSSKRGGKLGVHDFELQDYDSDNSHSPRSNHSNMHHSDGEVSAGSSSSRAGRASGWATPQLIVEPENGVGIISSPAKRGYFYDDGNISSGGREIGSSGSATARNGSSSNLAALGKIRESLLSRTESRERVTGVTRSRGASPRPGRIKDK